MKSADRYIESFYLRETFDEKLCSLRDKHIKAYRTKTIKSGMLLEAESYPVWDTGQPGAKKLRAVKGETREAQEKINHRNTQKKISRLINANFNHKDMWITVGYRNREEPQTMKEAKKDVQNYLRRLSRYGQKQGYEKLKYLYVIEQSERGRFHAHIVMNFRDRDKAEELWTHGEYPQARRLKPNDYGLEGLARYMGKEVKGQKSYGYSLGLYKSWEAPNVRISDRKISRRRAEKLSTGRVDPKTFYEALYPGYIFLDMEVRYSDYVSGCYLYARMKKKE